MSERWADTERVEWLRHGGVGRLMVKQTGLSSRNPSYEYRVRLNIGSADEQWRYSDPFTDLREAIDFGIANPLIKPRCEDAV